MSLKPYTNYVCSSGSGYGHQTTWTGAYRFPRESDGICVCGAPMVEDVDDGHRYRVQFETIDPFTAADYEARRGQQVWRKLSDQEWDQLPWHPVVREDKSRRSIEEQHRNLLAWAEARDQPIRHVEISRSVSSWEPLP